MADEEIERWITVKGNHIPILKGESEGDAINRFFSKFDDTDDTEIDIELDDEDKKVKYDTIYFTSVGYQDSIVNPEDIDKITANGYRVREMDITKEMKDLMDGLRTNPITSLGGGKIIKSIDFMDQSVYDVPKSNVMLYETDNGLTVVVRPSGTEPLIKFYITATLSAEENKKLFDSAVSDIDKIFA